MLFDSRPAALPVATLRSRTWTAYASRFRGGLIARWVWFRPRTVPVLVALVGMVALLASANYLSHLARELPDQPTMSQPDRIATVRAEAEPAPGILTINPPTTTTIYIDGKPSSIRPESLGSVMQLPTRGYHIKLIPLQPQP